MRQGGLQEWKERLAAAEMDLREREARACEDELGEEELRALAAERDKLASDRDALADAYDERAHQRDVSGLGRDVRASTRDRAAREGTQDLDPAAVDRFLAGTDRDRAAGDRADSLDDRGRAADDRHRAAEDRQRAADERDRAASRSDEQRSEIAGLRDALNTRLVIGQAEGLIMAQYGLDADSAFRLLTRLSQEAHLKLRDVAVRLVADATRKATTQRP